MANEMLARQPTGNYYSVTRDNQAKSQLETALNALLGQGVVSGGRVTKTAAFTVQIASGTVFFSRGVTLSLSDAQTYNTLATGAIYLWGKLARTAAAAGSPASEDTYALSLTHTTENSAPSDLHFLLATWTADGGGIDESTLDDTPAGKYVKIPREVTLATHRVSVGSTGISYRLECDISGVGRFEHIPSVVKAVTDQAGVIVEANLHEMARGAFGLTLYVPPDSTSGSYGGVKDLEITVTLAGVGWSSTTLTGVVGTWTALTEVE